MAVNEHRLHGRYSRVTILSKRADKDKPSAFKPFSSDVCHLRCAVLELFPDHVVSLHEFLRRLRLLCQHAGILSDLAPSITLTKALASKAAYDRPADLERTSRPGSPVCDAVQFRANTTLICVPAQFNRAGDHDYHETIGTNRSRNQHNRE